MDFQSLFSYSVYILGIGLLLPLGIVFCLGTVLSLLQAATQVQDQVISFFPKIIMICLLMFFGGPLVLEEIGSLLQKTLEAIVIM